MSLKALKAEVQRAAEKIRESQHDDCPTVIVIDVVNAREEGPHQIVPAGYTCSIQGKRHYFPGTSEQAVAAVLALTNGAPTARGMAKPVPVLMACLIEPTDETTTDASGVNGVKA